MNPLVRSTLLRSRSNLRWIRPFTRTMANKKGNRGTAQPVPSFDMDEFSRSNEREFLKMGGRIINLAEGTPDTDKSSVFRCTSDLQARITPLSSLYILDFIDNNGLRFEERTGFVVFGVDGNCRRYEMEPVGKDQTPDIKIELYFLSRTGKYEIRLRGGTQELLKTISFPPQLRCE